MRWLGLVFFFSPARLHHSQYFTELVSSQLLPPLSDITGRVMISKAAPPSVSHLNSPSEIHGIIFGQSNVSHCRLRRVQKGPPNGSHFYLFLKIQRLLKEQLDKVEDWKSLIFLFQ